MRDPIGFPRYAPVDRESTLRSDFRNGLVGVNVWPRAHCFRFRHDARDHVATDTKLNIRVATSIRPTKHPCMTLDPIVGRLDRKRSEAGDSWMFHTGLSCGF
jgi:hypothetical protein